ncbi:MAG: type II toxin-antitoxin system RelE/ParE family toxin [Candidatus Sericytochromatia bacterium]|nr:type II toxin-antitoxin system RelE/ParE family toxin [Candidatus Tanganyikabacteria bacterium]
MPFQVRLTGAAARDLEETRDFAATHDSRGAALRVLAKIERAVASLAEFPERGKMPMELSGLGQSEYRETVAGRYRIIYRLLEPSVFVYVIADGRRDFQSLLARRLLEG